MQKILILLPCIMAVGALVAQDYSSKGDIQASGGGISSGGGHKLYGTLGLSGGANHSGGNYTLTSGVTGIQLLVLLPDADASFELWMSNLPEAQKPPLDQRGPNDTPANDGVSNLFKYALGLLPLVPSAGAMPRLVFEGDYLAIELTRAKDRGVSWDIEFAPNLESWGSIGYSVLPMEDFGDTEKVRLVTDLTSATDPSAFLRLQLDPL